MNKFLSNKRRRGLALSLIAGTAAAAVGVTLVSTANAATPEVPEFTTGADEYQPEDNQSTCDPVPKPGVEDFRDLVLEYYTDTRDGGIAEDCDGETDNVSEHYEGRAWDWMIDAETQGDQADELLSWLLDERDGDAHALLRRFGIQYIIWDGQIISSYQIDEGWREYEGEAPHDDHVHFSFSWAGAQQETTWWTAQGEPSLCAEANLDFETYPELTTGDSGAEVTAAECILDRSGHPTGEGDPDGEFDEATAESVTAFQEASGIDASGGIDAATWTALLARGSTVQVKEGDENDHVARLQRVMTAASGETVTVDGKFGPELTEIVTRYQETAELDADGIVGPDTWRAMRAGTTL